MDKIVPIARQKIDQILVAGKKQLPTEEYARLVQLLTELQVYGITASINVELGMLMSRIQWGLEISESPEWAEALIKCDEAFLGNELRDMFLEMGMEAPRVHKKELCRRLYKLKHPAVVAVMEPYIKESGLEPAVPKAAVTPPKAITPPEDIEGKLADIQGILDEGNKANTLAKLERDLSGIRTKLEGLGDVDDAIREYKGIEKAGMTPEEYQEEKGSAFEAIQEALDNLSVIEEGEPNG